MDIFKAISLIALFILLIALLFIHFNNRKLSVELEKRNALFAAKLHLKELDNELSMWLYELGLPQLEEEKKRHEMACRLRTVLIEKLLRQKLPEKTLREILTEAFYSRD
jgi:hypothetical protein